MKFGFRTPSIKKSIKSRTTSKAKRGAKKAIDPFYGTKGVGIVKDPKKAMYNAVYGKTTVGIVDVAKSTATASNTEDNFEVSASTITNNEQVDYSKMSTEEYLKSKEASMKGQIKAANKTYSTKLGETARKAIFLNWAADCKAIGTEQYSYYYPEYFKYKYGIADPIAYHKSLVEEGLLEPADVKSIIESKKATEIKDILRIKGLPVSGKKDNLAARLYESLSEEEKNVFQRENKVYMLSESGKEFLSDKMVFIDYHKTVNDGESLKSFISRKGWKNK